MRVANLMTLLAIKRFRSIVMDAPWSSYDLLSSLIVVGIGLYLLIHPNLFQQISGVYSQFSSVAREVSWGVLFLLCGIVGIGTTLWCVIPSFGTRLLSRMGIAFCLLCFSFNNLLYDPPPLSTVTYGCLSVWSLWGILRTKASGR